LAVEHLGISPYLGVPIAAAGLMIMVVTGSYLRWERTVVLFCLLDLAWLWIAFKLQPGLGEIVHNTLVPGIPKGGLTGNLMFLMIAIVGTTIAPWQLFFQQSCIADKKLRFSDINWARLDTFLGACVTISVAGCMMVAGGYALHHGVKFEDPAQMANALQPIVGEGIRVAILLLMINAAILGTTAISLSSAWAYGEVQGWPHSLQLPFKQARGFYFTYVASVALAAAIVLIPRVPLQLIILGVQVLAGIMLPSAIIFLELLLNDKELLGDYVNKRWNNIVNWTIIIVLFALSLILAAQVVAPNLFPQG
jgi:Mn2+/Fe2+ NRAMP family transporter